MFLYLRYNFIMKKFIIIITLYVFCVNSVFATENVNLKNNFKTKYNEYTVKYFIKKQNFLANRKALNPLLETYSNDYINYDGYTKIEYENLIKDIWASYPKITYKSDIEKIVFLSPCEAEVYVKEYSKSKLPEYANLQGSLNSVSSTVYQLKKNGKKWLTLSDRILDEDTSMLYGEAQKLDINLKSPKNILPGQEYTSTLEIKNYNDDLVIASIAKEQIKYPHKIAKEVFRKLPDDGILERLFIANDDNKNEYVMASIGLTKTDINKEKIKVYLLGYGYKIIRVNVNNNLGEVGNDKEL